MDGETGGKNGRNVLWGIGGDKVAVPYGIASE